MLPWGCSWGWRADQYTPQTKMSDNLISAEVRVVPLLPKVLAWGVAYEAEQCSVSTLQQDYQTATSINHLWHPDQAMHHLRISKTHWQTWTSENYATAAAQQKTLWIQIIPASTLTQTKKATAQGCKADKFWFLLKGMICKLTIASKS